MRKLCALVLLACSLLTVTACAPVEDKEAFVQSANIELSEIYDVIEETGLDVMTEEGKVLRASEMRTEITDYTSFALAVTRLIEYANGTAVYATNHPEDVDEEYLRKLEDVVTLYTTIYQKIAK